MAENVFPWLNGLDGGDWNVGDATSEDKAKPSSATHDAACLSNDTRVPNRSLSALSGVRHSRRPSSQTSMIRPREPLADLSLNDANSTSRSLNDSTDRKSASSTFSIIQYGTVQVQARSKSSSPLKKDATLEWRKRLIHGQVGYGDQTDLFGPSALENIFVRSGANEKESGKERSRADWYSKQDVQNSDMVMPSSPPVWPINIQGSCSFPSGTFDLPKKFENRTQTKNGSNSDCAPEEHSIICHQTDANSGQKEDDFRGTPADHASSGRTILEQEDFSPVYVTKQTGNKGSVKYAAIDSYTTKRSDNIKIDWSERPKNHTIALEVTQMVTGDGYSEAGTDSEVSIDGPDLSLSENLPTGTPPVAALSDFVQKSRGGYSADGSFRDRLLSPSPSKGVSPEVSNVSQDLASVPGSPQNCNGKSATPDQSTATSSQLRSGEGNGRSSGSPLKLFGAHDTFTNNRLLRRLSQLESKTRMSDSRNSSGLGRSKSGAKVAARRINSNGSFGSGDLDNYQFEAGVTAADVGAEGEVYDGPSSCGSNPDEARSFRTDPVSFKLSVSARDLQPIKTRNIRPEGTDKDHPFATDKAQSLGLSKNIEAGKRPPNSPSKCPTPKRRRTLHISEIEGVDVRDERIDHSRKRKDARQGDVQLDADAATLAMRKILRPRNPTPGRARQEQIIAEIKEAAEEFAVHSLCHASDVIDQIDASVASENSQFIQEQAESLANQVAAFTLKISKPSAEYGERKRSVTTQDFLDEAIMVMNLIRAKARPQSGLGSLEESEAEVSAQLGHSGAMDSLRLSRPPSRNDSHSGWRTAVHSTNDSRIASHLRKFQDDDEGDLISEETREDIEAIEDRDDPEILATHFENSALFETNSAIVNFADESPHDVLDSPPTHSRPHSQGSQGGTIHTYRSEATSTVQTMCTNASKKSDNVGTLAPDAVAHLIGEQVGTMTFDREQQKWVRVKKISNHRAKDFLEPPSHATSDDDPFREISDLAVDEQDELRRVSATIHQRTSDIELVQNTHHDCEAEETHDGLARSQNGGAIGASSSTRHNPGDSSDMHSMQSSVTPFQHIQFNSSQREKVETRATSWSDEEVARVTSQSKDTPQIQTTLPLQATPCVEVEEIETVGELQVPLPTTVEDVSEVVTEFEQGHHKVDVAHSPNRIHEIRHRDNQHEWTDIKLSGQGMAMGSRRLNARSPTGKRQVSLRRRTLTGRLLATDTDDQSELSLIAAIPGDRLMSVSLSVTKSLRKVPSEIRLVEVQSPSPHHLDQTFYLSDLPDFTIHEEDTVGPSEQRLATRLAQHAMDDIQDRYALAVKDLVRTLTDIEEEEPFWEDLKRLNLESRCLVSLYGLEDFCMRVQEMTISNNSVTHLHGVPATLRRLDASTNQLTNLTAWSHLPNLQYLDVTNNMIDDLSSFKDLIHLRELSVDRNNIRELGTLEMDGLLEFSLRENQLIDIDFDGCLFAHLEHLDLSGNQIKSIRSLERLPALRSLMLDNNTHLQELRLEHELPLLEMLAIRNCALTSLDVTNLPQLRYLHVDDNSLSEIMGIESLPKLEVLSMRRQKLLAGEFITILESENSARSISLSGNALPPLENMPSFLNLQHLELASAGIHELPMDFGLRMPNLRTLNLNFNFLHDIRPLLNICKLAQLSVCGNRLDRLRKSVVTLAKMKSLQSLDLRDNPITQAFYIPSLTVTSKSTGCEARPLIRTECNGIEAFVERAKYQLPAANTEDDESHQARMDENTRMRRRVYELLLVNSCQRLENLDGLSFDRNKAAVKDEAFDRLVHLGIVRKSKTLNHDE